MFCTLIGITAFIGCQNTNGNSDIFTREKKQASDIVDQYFIDLKDSNNDEAMKFFHDRWYQEMTKAETEDWLKLMNDKLGIIDTYSMNSWEVKQYNENEGGRSGYYVNFAYTTTHEKFEAEENLTLYKANENDKYLILNHNVNSDAFNEEEQAQPQE